MKGEGEEGGPLSLDLLQLLTLFWGLLMPASIVYVVLQKYMTHGFLGREGKILIFQGNQRRFCSVCSHLQRK